MRMPSNIRNLIDDFYKNNQIDKRDYPLIYVHWHGMGDNGGIEEINLLTVEGYSYVIETTCNPANNSRDTQTSKYCLMDPVLRTSWDNKNVYVIRNFQEFHRDSYAIDEWLYTTFELCEINDGSFAHIYIDALTGQVWGEAEHYVQETVPGVTIEYENRSAPSGAAESSNK
jgi:hypothetical protein